MLKLLTITTLAIASLSMVQSAVDCNAATVWANIGCSSDGTSVSIGGSQSTKGNSNTAQPGASTPRGKSDSTSSESSESAPQDRPSAPDRMRCEDWEFEFIYVVDCIRVDTEDASSPVVTIHDLVRFLPQTGPVVAEPEGVGVAGLPTNFVAPTGAHTAHGMLFARPISVRFTPVGHSFDYGDGTIRHTITNGNTWSALGVPQFTPTDTSHTYRDRGSYTTRVTTRYTAEVNLGYGWARMSGELTAQGQAQSLRIYEARTALVAQTCDNARSAAGC